MSDIGSASTFGTACMEDMLSNIRDLERETIGKSTDIKYKGRYTSMYGSDREIVIGFYNDHSFIPGESETIKVYLRMYIQIEGKLMLSHSYTSGTEVTLFCKLAAMVQEKADGRDKRRSDNLYKEFQKLLQKTN